MSSHSWKTDSGVCHIDRIIIVGMTWHVISIHGHQEDPKFQCIYIYISQISNLLFLIIILAFHIPWLYFITSYPCAVKTIWRYMGHSTGNWIVFIVEQLHQWEKETSQRVSFNLALRKIRWISFICLMFQSCISYELRLLEGPFKEFKRNWLMWILHPNLICKIVPIVDKWLW